MAIEQVKPFFNAQALLAKGVTYCFRIDIGARGGRSDPVLVTDVDEMHEAIAAIDEGGGRGEIYEDSGGPDEELITRRYYFLSTKAPDNKALDSILDRSLGKAVGLVELPPDSDTGAVVAFIFKRNETNSAGDPANN